MTRIASLCSGYEGIGLGLAEALDVDLAESLAWHAEFVDAPARIHEHHFPGVPNYRDIKTICWPLCEPVDWLTAGYPCQPFSLAGLRKGNDDPRHLWPYVADAIRVLRPGRVLLENVPGHLSKGFGTVLGDLAKIGYDARWVCLPASGVGANHERKRVFILATDTNGDGLQGGGTIGRPSTDDPDACTASTATDAARDPWRFIDRDSETATDAARIGWPERLCESNGVDDPSSHGRPSVLAGNASYSVFGKYAPAVRRWERVTGRPAPGPLELGPKGNWRYAARFGEWMMGLPDGWITSPEIGLSYSAQKKAIGNGVVPQQCAEAVRHLMSPL